MWFPRSLAHSILKVGQGPRPPTTDEYAAFANPVSATVAAASTSAPCSLRSTSQPPPLYAELAVASDISVLAAPTTSIPPSFLSSARASNTLSEPVSISTFAPLDHGTEKLHKSTNMACLEIYSLRLDRLRAFKYDGVGHSRCTPRMEISIPSMLELGVPHGLSLRPSSGEY